MDIYIYIDVNVYGEYLHGCVHIYVRNLWKTMIQQVNIACFK